MVGESDQRLVSSLLEHVDLMYHFKPMINYGFDEILSLVAALIAISCLRRIINYKEEKNGVKGVVKLVYHKKVNLATHKTCIRNCDDLFTKNGLPQDAIQIICLFLHPMEVTTLACLDHSSRNLIDGPTSDILGNENSNNIWRALWVRDYSCVIVDWEVGREALKRSTGCNFSCEETPIILSQTLDKVSATSTKSMKTFYFNFHLSYINYLLAGHNTDKRCLLGLHGHILDFTNYAQHHPGLSEPIMVECGRDATEFFEDIPHSKGARKIARKLCVVVDRACCFSEKDDFRSWGLYLPPTSFKNQAASTSFNTRPPQDSKEETALGINHVLPMTVTKTREANNLRFMRNHFTIERHRAELWAKIWTIKEWIYALKLQNGNVSDLRVYHDPFLGQWKGWCQTTSCDGGRISSFSELD